MITLQKLKIFTAAADLGSFNRAASELFLTQSAVSQHIQTLETALGAPLFVRSARGARLTPAGEILYKHAVQIFSLLNTAEREIMALDPSQPAPLSVSATPGLSVYLLPAWLQRLQAATPQVSISLQTLLTSEVVRGVLSGAADLGFVEGELDELDQPELGRMRVTDVEYVAAFNPAHEWRGRHSLSAVELTGQPFINRQPGSRARRWLEQALKARGVRLRTVAELDSPGAIKYALLNRMGVAILPRYTFEREAERGELVALSISDLDLKRPLLLIWDRRDPFTPIERAFLLLLAEDAPHLQLLL